MFYLYQELLQRRVFLCLPTEGGEGQMSTEEEEARRIAEMGKPILGEHSRLEVVIEESYEFKVLIRLFSSTAPFRSSPVPAVSLLICGIFK